jgi:hypothetical protein
MIALVCFVWSVLISPFKSDSRLEAENVALRHQVMVLRRQVRGRVHLSNFDRWLLVQLYRWCLSILRVLCIVQPETVVRWHRAGFRRYRRWKSRRRGCSEPADGRERPGSERDGSAPSHHDLFSVVFTINTFGFEFSAQTTRSDQRLITLFERQGG